MTPDSSALMLIHILKAHNFEFIFFFNYVLILTVVSMFGWSSVKCVYGFPPPCKQ